MQKNPVKKYEMEDLMEIYDPKYPGTPIFIPKEYIWMSCTGGPPEIMDPLGRAAPEPHRR